MPVRRNLDAVSLCMIARDEAAWIGEALDSVRELAGEMIVVDTGSTDNTVEVASRHGARVEAIAWTGSFAAARNESLRFATGDWVFILDADERVAPADVPRIKTVIAEAPVGAYLLNQRTYLYNSAIVGWKPNNSKFGPVQGLPGYIEAQQIRLFPNRSALRYRGEVHESLEAACAVAGVQKMFADIVIHHFGRVKQGNVAEDIAKGQRYLQLGLEKIADGSADLISAGELATQLFELGYMEKTRYVLDWMLGRDPWHRNALNMMGKVLARRGESVEARNVLSRLVERYPDFSDGWNSLAVAYMEEGDTEGALPHLRRAAAADPENANAIANLALVESRLGQFDTAASNLAKARRINPCAARYRLLDASLLLNQKRIQAAGEEFDRIVAEPLYFTAHDLFQLVQLGMYLSRVDNVARFIIDHLDDLMADRVIASRVAEMLQRNGCVNAAEVVLGRVASVHPDWADAHNELGRLLAGKGRFEPALAAFSTATKLDPGNVGYLKNLALVCEKLDLVAQAVECYSSMVALAPETLSYAQTRIDALERRAAGAVERPIGARFD